MALANQGFREILARKDQPSFLDGCLHERLLHNQLSRQVYMSDSIFASELYAKVQVGLLQDIHHTLLLRSLRGRSEASGVSSLPVNLREAAFEEAFDCFAAHCSKHEV